MRRRRVQAGIVALVLVIGLLANAGWRWWHNRPPYGPEVLAATATLQFVSNEEAAAALGRDNAPWAEPGDQLAVGLVSWQPPPNPQPDATFWIVVLDKRTHLNAAVQAVTSPRDDDVGLGSHGYLQRAVDRYPWLRGIAGREINGTWWTNGTSVYVSAADATPVTFAVVFPAIDEPLPPEQAIPTAPIALSDLLVALINVGPDGQIYWADRLLG